MITPAPSAAQVAKLLYDIMDDSAIGYVGSFCGSAQVQGYTVLDSDFDLIEISRRLLEKLNDPNRS